MSFNRAASTAVSTRQWPRIQEVESQSSVPANYPTLIRKEKACVIFFFFTYHAKGPYFNLCRCLTLLCKSKERVTRGGEHR